MKLGEQLKACLSALIIVSIVLLGVDCWSQYIIKKHNQILAPEFCDIKLHGTSSVKQAFRENGTLVLFGSSELLQDIPFKSFIIEKDNKTFNLFPVGKAGTTSFAHAQKVGSVGDELRNKQLVISLSPSFFFNKTVNKGYLLGNSSVVQIKNLLLSSLDFKIKKRFVARLQVFPEIYETSNSLKMMIYFIQNDHYLLHYYFKPCFMFMNVICNSQDRVETALEIINTKQKHVYTCNLNTAWANLLKTANIYSNRIKQTVTATRDSKEFLTTVHNAEEWGDFDLLLSILEFYKVTPLILSMPVHDDILTSQGLNKEIYRLYAHQLQQIANKHKFKVRYFNEFEKDASFFLDNNDHLSSKGWLYYNYEIGNYFRQ